MPTLDRTDELSSGAGNNKTPLNLGLLLVKNIIFADELYESNNKKVGFSVLHFNVPILLGTFVIFIYSLSQYPICNHILYQ